MILNSLGEVSFTLKNLGPKVNLTSQSRLTISIFVTTHLAVTKKYPNSKFNIILEEASRQIMKVLKQLSISQLACHYAMGH